MLGSFPQSQYTPCPECGVSLASAAVDQHVCEQERWLDYQLFGQRGEIARFEDDLATYLASAEGQFELWYAERARRKRPR